MSERPEKGARALEEPRRTFAEEVGTCCVAVGCGLSIGVLGLILSTIVFLTGGGHLG